MLRNAGFTIKIHDDIFSPNENDSVWLEKCSQKRWIVITPDTNIIKDQVSMRTIGANRGRVFFLSSNNSTSEVWANALIGAYTDIMKTIRNYDAPFIARISPTGIVWLVKELTSIGREKKRRKTTKK